MKFGIILPSYGPGASRAAIFATAQMAEELEYDSIWTTDHILVPRTYRDLYGSAYDVMLTLSYLAAKTSRVSLGTSIVVAPLRHPAQLAKQAATLDDLSQGRLILGMAAGYLEEEFGMLGVDFASRGRRFHETVEAMRAIWRQDEVNYKGEFFEFSNAFAYPKPVRREGPPVWIGGSSDAAIRRAATIGDGWHPNGGISLAEFANGVIKLKEWARGRCVTVSLRQSVVLRPTATPSYRDSSGNERHRIAGSSRQVMKSIEAHVASGLEHLACEFEEIESSSGGGLNELIGSIRTFAKEIVPSFK